VSVFLKYGHAYSRNRVCISSTVTRVRGRRSGVRIPCALDMFLSPIQSLQPTKPPIQLILAAIFPWLKRQEHEVFHSHNLVLRLRICGDVCTDGSTFTLFTKSGFMKSGHFLTT
jgi:hypothetical protein